VELRRPEPGGQRVIIRGRPALIPVGALQNEAFFVVPVLGRRQLNHCVERYLEMGAFVLRLAHEVAVQGRIVDMNDLRRRSPRPPVRGRRHRDIKKRAFSRVAPPSMTDNRARSRDA